MALIVALCDFVLDSECDCDAVRVILNILEGEGEVVDDFEPLGENETDLEGEFIVCLDGDALLEGLGEPADDLEG